MKSATASSKELKKDSELKEVLNLLKKPIWEKSDPAKVKHLKELKVDLKESKAKAKALGLSIRKAPERKLRNLKQRKRK